jgi:hypothetical protein
MTTHKVVPRDYAGWQQPVKDILNDPPATPSEGDRYLVDTVPTGVWVGHAGHIATYNSTPGWDFATPTEGWYVFDCDSNVRMFYGGSAWTADSVAGETNTASNLGDGAGQVYKQKVGVDIQLRSVKAGTGINVTNNTNDITLSTNDSAIVHNSLSGYSATNHRATNFNASTNCIEITI